MPPPFHADHVGSLLRPAALKDARERFLGVQTAGEHLGPHYRPHGPAVADPPPRDPPLQR